MSTTRRHVLTALAGASLASALPFSAARAAGIAGAPGIFGKRQVKIALVRYLSTGDFFQFYLAGVTRQAAALGIDLHVLDSRQDAALQAEMLAQAMNMGVDGIILQHGLTETLKDPAARAVAEGFKVVAFDVNCENPKIPQIEQNDRELARLSLEQAIRDNGEAFKAGYVYVPGIAPLDRRDETWQAVKKKYPKIVEVARWGTMNNPIANSVADQTAAVLRANPDIKMIFAPFDEFAKGVKTAVDEAGLSKQIKIYSADISTPDISAMIEKDSAWSATTATNSAVVGEVCVRSLALLLAGIDPGREVVVPPTLITQAMLAEKGIKNMEELAAKIPQFSRAEVAMAPWIPEPKR
ncbi:sugar ABC transporter substrate-binding protein [Siculibacillus lacustris]|uniref:Sugar ABC transporter substrate-binding protein n=1 Tax=Siculibacillus lacustris TaxID=1549641 RepID=A0A4Q9VLB0_9HYPH|nr:substrate-binding domain-containing protein [Siculibacillus lacustris]TBW36270.1 sugar ABC transporter substrate-binding protein [Siculibacillus lacustris]